jgi:signal transduction histidine kinase
MLTDMKTLKAFHKLKTLKTLIQLDLALLTFMGWSATFGNSRSIMGLGRILRYSSEDDPVLKLLGMGMFVLGGLLFLASEVALVGSLRRFGRWLAAANLAIAVTAFIQGTGRHAIEWGLLLVPLVMAVLLAWASNYPAKPGEVAAELAKLRIPEEVRQALLLQVGESAAQEERNRLARDLHDSIKQQLFTISVSAATAQERWERDPEGARAALADVRRSAREAMVEMQAMLHQLRPQALTSAAGLVEALREQCEALGYRTGSEVTLELGDLVPDDRMPPGAQEALFRIAQETLSNVARHARAGKVRVWFGREGEQVVLRVKDDGQGFDPRGAVSGMGLQNLRERAVAFRGKVEIESEPGAGTRVVASLPLAALPQRHQKRLERAARWERGELWGPLVIALLFLSFRPFRDGAQLNDFIRLGLVVFMVGSEWFRRGKLPAVLTKGEDPAVLSRLRAGSHRSRALLLLVASWWIPGYRPLFGEGTAEWILWAVAALLLISLSAYEIVRFHQLSEPRRWRRGFAWRSPSFLTAFLVAAFSLGALRSVLILPLLPWEIVFLLLGAAAVLYFIVRQPPETGAPV